MHGDYTIALTVTDSPGLSSAPDTVTVSTTNTAPVADAGTDQALIVLGSNVVLDGTQSYDDDGDDIYYSWTITQEPAGSTAVFDDSAYPTPSFVAYVYGDYIIELVVDDTWAESDPDTVTISFDNVKPVADAGVNQAVLVGDSVFLDGGGSTDANGDTLTYSWSFVSRPTGSTAVLDDPTSQAPSFVADVAGPDPYVVSLVVNDGFVSSDPDNVTVMATSRQDELIDLLGRLIYEINGLDIGVFKNRNMPKTLTNKINATIAMIDSGDYAEALDKLENDILGKTDGCAAGGEPDRNDWIRDCNAQAQVYNLITEAIGLLQSLI
jgi:hypothetical protein